MRFEELFEVAEHYDDAYLKKKYDYYNKLLFSGKLPDIPIKYAKMKGMGGAVKYKTRFIPGAPEPNRMRVRLGLESRYSNRELVSMILQISTLYTRDAKSIDAILIHEMIHVYFLSTGDLEETHGIKFLRMRSELSKKVGFEIPLTDNVKGLEVAEVSDQKFGFVLRYEDFGNGMNVMLTMLNAKFLQENVEAFKNRWKEYPFKTIIGISHGVASSKYKLQRKPGKYGFDTYKPDQKIVDEIIKNAEILATVGKY